MSEIKEINYEYILGPITLTEHWHPKYQKRVYIFGDVHTNIHRCENSINIANFLDKTINYNKDKTIDIFLEAPLLKEGVSYYQENEIYEGQGFLFGDIRREFNNCLQISKEECKYKNARFHYCDVRHFDRRFEIITQVLKYLSSNFHTFDNKNIIGFTVQLTDRKVAKSLLERDMTNCNEIYNLVKNLQENVLSFGPINFNKLLKLFKINRQIENIPYKEVKEALSSEMKNIETINIDILQLLKDIIEFTKGYISIFSDFIIAYNDENKELYSILNEKLESLYIKYDTDKLITALKIQYQYISTYSIGMMDYYLLARMFRKFKGTVDEPYNIITYTGNAHSKNYRNFLDKLGFELIASSETPSRIKCLPIKNFNQPFFASV